MSGVIHSARIRSGMLAASQLRGARKRWSAVARSVGMFGPSAVNTLLNGTAVEIDMLLADVHDALPSDDVARRHIAFMMTQSNSTARRFIKRNENWLLAQIVHKATPPTLPKEA